MFTPSKDNNGVQMARFREKKKDGKYLLQVQKIVKPAGA